MPCEPLVDKRIVGRDQIENAPIFADNALEEEVGFLDERPAKTFVEIRKESVVRSPRLKVAHEQPLRCKAGHQTLGAPVGEHPLDLPCEHWWIPQLGRQG